MTRKDPQLNLRLPADLKEMLEEAAEKQNRSVTAETVERLRASFANDRNTTHTLFLMARLEMRVAELELENLGLDAIARAMRAAVEKLIFDNEHRHTYTEDQRKEDDEELLLMRKVLEAANAKLGAETVVGSTAARTGEKVHQLQLLKSRVDALFHEMGKKLSE